MGRSSVSSKCSKNDISVKLVTLCSLRTCRNGFVVVLLNIRSEFWKIRSRSFDDNSVLVKDDWN